VEQNEVLRNEEGIWQRKIARSVGPRLETDNDALKGRDRGKKEKTRTRQKEYYHAEEAKKPESQKV